jgi:hypothetical protein
MVGILLASLIWWDHLDLFNHLSFFYIMMDLSWKGLSKKKVASKECLRLNRLRMM